VIDTAALLRDLRAEVKNLEDDLLPTALADRGLREEWQAARNAGRTAAAFEDPWLKERITQAAVVWVMATVFVRFSEDNDLIDVPFLSGPADRLPLALDQQTAHFTRHPEQTDRDWIVAALDRLSTSAATMRLFDDLYRLMRQHPISHEAATRLIDFWRKVDADGQLVHNFTDNTRNTGFLGDLYQDLSDSARKAYALMQTPDFIADFIVSRTVQPAIDTFGVRGLRVIDPVCGAGSFLLLAFKLILDAHRKAEPDAVPWDLIGQSLASVHGIDQDATAVAVCRFRLLLAAMAAAGARQLAEAPVLPLIVAAGDSLLPCESVAGAATTQPSQARNDAMLRTASLLNRGSYHAVFGEPPYLAARDSALKQLYRSHYPVCRGQYTLTVPFIEQFFRLARQGGEHAGFVGMLVSNSFMKREFGRPLVEEFLSQVELSLVADTSGVFIPGHGTPTLIMLGRARFPEAATVRTLLGVRGEPAALVDPRKGFVWAAIQDQVDRPGTQSEWISSQDTERERFERHPWVLAGSSTSDLLAKIEALPRLGPRTTQIGYMASSGSDDAFIAPASAFQRIAAEPEAVVPVVTGSEVRDWDATAQGAAFFPSLRDGSVVALQQLPHHERRLWPYRTTLGARSLFAGQRLVDTGRAWYSWHQVARSANTHPWSIVFAWVATMGHFALLRDNTVPLQSAPVIKLPAAAGDDDVIGLLAILNSSTACCWLKHNSQAKGAPRADQLRAEEAWERVYEFTSTSLGALPVPARFPVSLGTQLIALAGRLTAAASADDHKRIRARMVALQEELDWVVYHHYSLTTDAEFAELVAPADSVPGLELGERAFEIVMARQMAAGKLDTQWFTRHGSTPVTEIPAHWPVEYKKVVQARIEFIGQDRNVGLIERPEFKRRWQTRSWEAKEQARLKAWLLDRCEKRELWFDESGQPHPLTISSLADRLRMDPEAVAVAGQLAGDDADMFEVIGDLVDGEHVPYLAQLRYKGKGLVKRAVWEQTWNLQREEDRDAKRLDIPVPPKYTSADFLRPSFWRNRGKLDVPKERFVSYPGADTGGGDSLLLGWAGWDHREQAHALVTLITDRAATDRWGKDQLTPLIAGLAEVMPWVRQWHSEPTEFGQSWADAYDTFLTEQCERFGLTDDDLTAWKPPAPRRGRPPKNSASPRPKVG
jgi:hypothetical protein